MKKLLMISLLAAFAMQSDAQGFFNQQGARIKNLAKQFALFKTYASLLEKGYAIAQAGLSRIGSSKLGDLRIHTDHFAARSVINPSIVKQSKGLDILRFYTAIKKIAKQADPVYRSLLQRCEAAMEELDQLLVEGGYQLSDAERIARIQKVYQSMQDMNSFAQYYAGEQSILLAQQIKIP